LQDLLLFFSFGNLIKDHFITSVYLFVRHRLAHGHDCALGGASLYPGAQQTI